MRKVLKSQFLEAYDLYADAIYRHCFFRVYSKPLAEELTQETFLKTWQYLAEGKEVENLRAFLYRVANNLIIDHSRRKKEEHLDVLLETSPDLEPSGDSRAELEQAQAAKEALAAIQDLRPEERDILMMRYVEEMDLKEIAAALDISVNNVSVRLNRAIKALRKELTDETSNDLTP